MTNNARDVQLFIPIFVQGVLWGVNSFDQWGVELGKKIANKLVPIIQDELDASSIDGSTRGLIKRYSNIG